MPVAGLILTDDELPVQGGVRTLLPLAGQTLIEYQARIARACGVGHIVVLVDNMPAALVAAFDRLRADGIDIDIARDAREAADRIHPEEQLLVMAPGTVASREIVARLTASDKPTLLTLVDGPDTVQFERIDGVERWTGLALLNGDLLRQTAAMLGDWTLGPTLLRTALQRDARRKRHEGGGLALVQNERDAQSIAEFFVSGSDSGGSGFWHGQVIKPAVSKLLPILLTRNVSLDVVVVLPVVLLALSMIVAAIGWTAASFGIFLLAAFPAAAGKVMTDIAVRPDRLLRWADDAKLPVLLALLCFAGWAVDVAGAGWGAFVLALWAGIALILQPRTEEREPWLANADLVAVELLMASLIGQTLFGLMIAVSHAVISQFYLVRRRA